MDYAFIVAFVLLLVFTATVSDVFFTQRNLSNLGRQAVTNGMLSLGMLVVILTGGIDLSVGSVVALAAVMVSGMSKGGMPLSLAILICMAVGVLAGAVNGFFIARFKLQSFIVTLATMGAIRGLVFVYSDIPITPTDPAFRAVLGAGFVGPFPVSALIMVACYPIVWFFLNRAKSGRAIVAIGGNEEAVRLAGISVTWHIFLAYMISGLFSALAGVMLASRLGIAQPSVGVGVRAGCHRRLSSSAVPSWAGGGGECLRHAGRGRGARRDRQPAQSVQRAVVLSADLQGRDYPGRGPGATQAAVGEHPAGLHPGGAEGGEERSCIPSA